MERFKRILQEISKEYHINVWRDNFRKETLAEGYEKVKGGVKYFIRRYPNNEFGWDKFKDDIERYGWFSQRPYQLAQSCDGSIGTPVMALYYHYCKAKGINPNKTILQAYPETKAKNNWKDLIRDANWQGVDYPKQWGDKEFEGLLESLTEINNHSLNDLLQEMRDTSKRQEELQNVHKAKEAELIFIRGSKLKNRSMNLGR